MKRAIDHIVYCVPDLDEGIKHIENEFGIRPIIGGRHMNKGTKNALLNLGNKCYLEILAIDDENVDYNESRWMGIDLIDKPKITRWSLKSDRLQEDSRILKKQSPNLGIIDEGSRKTSDGRKLTWQMILPTSSPEIDLIPFMTDWSLSESHPSDVLAEGCYLKNVELFHPNPSIFQSTIDNLNVEVEIITDTQPSISIIVETPNGIRRL